MFAIQFLLQALYLTKTSDNGIDGLKNTLRGILCKEKIETEFNGLKETSTGIVDENLSADLLCTLCTLKDELDNAQKVKAALDALSDYLKSLDKPFYVKTDL